MSEKSVFDVIHSRRSIKQFTDDEINKENLLKIAEAARATPTSVNLQSRKFTIVQNKNLINKLSKSIGEEIGDFQFDLYKPDAVLLISTPRNYTYSQIETGLAVQNAYLAATALGLGTTWTDQIRNHSEVPSVRQVLTEMEIPDNHICWCILPIGVPATIPQVKNRTEDINFIG